MVKEILESVVKEFGPLTFETYRGKEPTYLVYNYEDARDKGFADDAAEYERQYIQVHYFAPKAEYKEATRKKIKQNLMTIADVTSTVTREEIETKTIHITFSIEIDMES